MSGVVSLNHLGAAWAEAMWRASWQGAVALLAALLISRLLPRLAPPLRAWLWRLAFFKLVLGLISLPPIVLPVLPPAAAPVVAAIPATAPATIVQPMVATAPLAAPATAPPAAAAPAARIDPCVWLLGAWLLTVLAYAGHLVRCWSRARRLQRACRRVQAEALTTALADLCRRARVRPPALLTGQVMAPLLLGLRRPAVILPESLSAAYGDSRLRLVLAHEVAHLRRRDLLWNWLPLLAQGLFLFHPLAWLGRREWALAQEMACDAEALALTAASEAEYGDMLVRVALPRQAFRSDPLAAGITESHHTLRRRLRALVHFAPITRRRLIAGGLAITALALLVLVPWRAAARKAGATRSAVRVVLTIPYGSGSGQVGRLWTPDGVPELAAVPPTGPTGPVALRMIQQTPDGTVWVLDVANGRVLGFRNGEQTEAIPLALRNAVGASFAVTPSAIFVVEGWHVRHLTRYDRAGRAATTIDLRLPNGEAAMPMWVAPLDARGGAVLVAGKGAASAFRVEGDGRVTLAIGLDPQHWLLPIPGADGGIWRFRTTRRTLAPGGGGQIEQGAIERYDAPHAHWREVAAAVLPEPRGVGIVSWIGVDARGGGTCLLNAAAGSGPDRARFVQLDRRGKVLATFALRDLGLDLQLGYAIGDWMQCQLLPDGDLLLLAAAPGDYRVLQVRPLLVTATPAPLLSQLVSEFVVRFTRGFYAVAITRSDAEAIVPMVEAVEVQQDDADTILNRCRNSSAADAVAAQLLAPLEAHARKYRPGSRIDETLLSKQTVGWRELPGRDLPADAYLLFELAERRRSAPFTRRALLAVADAAAADGYLREQKARHNRVHAGDVAQEAREGGGYHTQTVDALAWCAENFLIDAYETRPSYLPPAARKEVDAYIAWRQTAAGTDPQHHGWLPSSQAYSTLTHARRIAAKLPA